MIRFSTLDVQVFENYGRTDYLLHAVLGGIVSKGVSPYSKWMYTYIDHFGIGHPLVPRIYIQYIGGTLFNSAIIRLTGLSSDFVTFSLSPAITNIILAISIYVSCRILKLNGHQSFFFFILFAFLNDQMIYRSAYGSSEHLSTSIAIIGISLFLKGKYYWATIPLSVSCVMHPVGIGRFVILGTYVFLSTSYVFIKDNFSFNKLIGNRSNNHPNRTRIFSLILIGLVIGAYLYPMFFKSPAYVIEYTNTTVIEYMNVTTTEIVSVNITDPITNEVIGVENITITKDIVVENISFVQNESIKEFIIDSPLEIINHGSNNLDYARWYLPRTPSELLRVFSYPISYFYWGFMSRVSLNSTMTLFRYNLTLTDVENLRQFNLNTPLPVILVPLIYGFGFPLLFALAIRECLKTKDSEKILLTVSSYFLIIFFSLGYYLFGISLFPERFIRLVGEFSVFTLLGSDIFNPKSNNKKNLLWIFSIFLIIRFVVFFLGIVANGAL